MEYYVMLEFTAVEWTLLAVGAIILGIAKTGIPGISIVFIPVLASILPAKASTGFLLPMLIIGDIFAVLYYKRHAQWKYLIKLIPFSLVGVAIGYFTMRLINNEQLQPIIGIIVLVMLGVQFIRSRRKEQDSIPQGIWFALTMGIAAGFTTMIANAAGPIMAIYLLAMRLPKEQYIGTGAWYFFIVNLLKVPLSASLGLITGASLLANAMLIPGIAIGAFIGIKVLKRIPQKAFRIAILVIATGSAIRLLFM
ncbi:MAG: sulfite exporter TauE/SafE family protein [Spirochaetales bacterium]|jgi:uncharacterized protein|nr:sulfite exporter TauE/SafE family protein [Spirochaetales bacterium]